MENKVSLLVGVKNQYLYTKNFYERTRLIYPNVEIVFVSYGSTDSTRKLLGLIQDVDSNVIIHVENESKTLSDTYNKAAEIATKDYIIMCHNDLILAPGFIENIVPHLQSKRCVTYTTVEPSIFIGHSRPGKIVADFGDDLETFNYDKFYKYCENFKFKNDLEPGWAFFMSMLRSDYIELGGMDNLFNPMFCEDDDLRLRLQLAGFEFIVSNKAMSYHFVSKTSRFDPEVKAKTHTYELNSNRNFIRKWRFRNSQYNKSVPITWIFNGINNFSSDLLIEMLEPWFDHIKIDTNNNVQLISEYINKHQPTTKIDLTRKFVDISSIKYQVEIKRFQQEDYDIITKLQDIISENEPEPGLYQINEFITLTVN